jgi:hypothetical protein
VVHPAVGPPLLSKFHPKLPSSGQRFFSEPKWEANPMHQLRPGLVQSLWRQVESFRRLTMHNEKVLEEFLE